MNRSEYWWHSHFLQLAEHVASASKDPSTQCGAVIIDADRRVVGTGYNGFPRGVDDSTERYRNRDLKYKLVVHAEVNACLTAGDRARGGTLYVVPAFGVPPICENCAKVAIQAGIRRIVGYSPDPTKDFSRWAESLGFARLMFEEAGIKIVNIGPRP